MIHDSYFREGMFAGYAGKSPFDCPYGKATHREQYEKYMAGWSAGVAQRRVDHRNGRSPDLVERSEFGFETGYRAGKSIAGRR